MSEIRNLAREDVPAVAALFQKTFRKAAGPPPASLAAYLAAAHFDHPWFDPETGPRVHVNGEERVTGFVGVFPGRFTFRGRRVRAAIAGSLMVEDPAREPLAGAKLLRAVVKGPQDISISETTNLVSQGLWEKLGGRVVPLLSLDWVRIFRPAAAGLSMLAERAPQLRMFAPAAWAGDRISRPWARNHLSPGEPDPRLTTDTAPGNDDFAKAVRELSATIELRPDWSEPDLEWLLEHAARKARYGPCSRSIVRNAKGELIGCYIYHGKPGGTGRALQVLARPDAVEGVVDCLFREANAAGLSALRGRSAPQLANALIKRDCLFTHRSSTVILSRDAELCGGGGGRARAGYRSRRRNLDATYRR